MNEFNEISRKELILKIIELRNDNKILRSNLAKYRLIFNCYENYINFLQQIRDKNKVEYNVKESQLKERLIAFKSIKLCEIKLNVFEVNNWIKNQNQITIESKEKTTNNQNSGQKIAGNNRESNNLDSMEEMSIDLNEEKREQIIDNNFGKVNKQIETNNNLINDNSFETISQTNININSNQNECKLRKSERHININAFYSSNDSDSDDFHPFSEEQSLLCSNECLDESERIGNKNSNTKTSEEINENNIIDKQSINSLKQSLYKEFNQNIDTNEEKVNNSKSCGTQTKHDSKVIERLTEGSVGYAIKCKTESDVCVAHFDVNIDSSQTQIDSQFDGKKKRKKAINKSNYSSKRNSDLRESLVCVHNNCLVHFNSPKNLRIHQLRSHPEMFPDIAFIKCEKKGCNYRTKYKTAMRRHSTRHPELNPNCEQFECKQIGCNYSTKVKCNFVQHKCGHNLPFSCDVCQSRFRDRRSLKTHVSAKHINKRPFVCSFNGCDKSYFSKLSLKRHEKIHKGVKYKCYWNDCGKQFISYSTYCKHVQKHGTKKFKCHYIECDKEFWTPYDLREHMNRHTGNKPYVCEWPGCEKRFAANTYLHLHKKYHLNERKHVCDWPECDYATNNGSNLVKHKAIHTRDFRYSCVWPHCQYNTSNHSNLVTHQKQHK